jgi:hypothetical protein
LDRVAVLAAFEDTVRHPLAALDDLHIGLVDSWVGRPVVQVVADRVGIGDIPGVDALAEEHPGIPAGGSPLALLALLAHRSSLTWSNRAVDPCFHCFQKHHRGLIWPVPTYL